MQIDVKRISKLSMLEIEDDKIEKFTNDIQEIIEMVNNLPDFDSVDEELSMDNVMTLREDVAKTDKFKREELLSNAPFVESGCIVVPKTVD
jgi:aspartyl-tRNA(Asn)/glutamyl-tRNA(Gln) amidotransferase subunit C